MSCGSGVSVRKTNVRGRQELRSLELIPSYDSILRDESTVGVGSCDNG